MNRPQALDEVSTTEFRHHGGYARGWFHRPDVRGRREYEAIIELMRSGWGRDNPAFRQLFTSRFIPDGTQQQLEWWNDLCRKSATPEMAVALLRTRGEIEVSGLLRQVRTPTLIVHSREDAVVPLAEGRQLAAEMLDKVLGAEVSAPGQDAAVRGGVS